MLTPLLLGLLFGTGILLIVRGFMPPHPALAEALRTIDERAGIESHGRSGTGIGGARRLTTPTAAWLVDAMGLDADPPRRDLRLIGRSAERHALDKLLVGCVFFSLPAVVSGLMIAAGETVPWSFVALGSLVLGAIGFVVPDLNVRGEAERRRREFRHALAAYLDLVVIVVAGGGGTETSLHDAAEAGSGWAFAAIRRALTTARLSGTTPWSALRDLGSDLGVRELGELAAGVSLAGEHGARVRSSLTAKAHSLREHQLAETETAAQEATEKMSIPVVLLLFGFLAFVLYPALQLVLDGL